MQNILLFIFILSKIIYFLIIIDIILSWLTLLWINFRIEYIKSILEPIYEKIKKIFPTIIWPFEFAPLILLMFIFFIQALIISFNSDILAIYNDIIKF